MSRIALIFGKVVLLVILVLTDLYGQGRCIGPTVLTGPNSFEEVIETATGTGIDICFTTDITFNGGSGNVTITSPINGEFDLAIDIEAIPNNTISLTNIIFENFGSITISLETSTTLILDSCQFINSGELLIEFDDEAELYGPGRNTAVTINGCRFEDTDLKDGHTPTSNGPSLSRQLRFNRIGDEATAPTANHALRNVIVQNCEFILADNDPSWWIPNTASTNPEYDRYPQRASLEFRRNHHFVSYQNIQILDNLFDLRGTFYYRTEAVRFNNSDPSGAINFRGNPVNTFYLDNSDIVIRGNVMHNDSHDPMHGIFLQGPYQTITIDNNEIYGFGANFYSGSTALGANLHLDGAVHLYGARRLSAGRTDVADNDDITITRNTIDAVSRGLLVLGATNVTINNDNQVTINDWPEYWATHTDPENIIYEHDRFGILVATGEPEVIGFQAHTINIEDNRVYCNELRGVTGISVRGARDVEVTGNRVYSPNAYGILFWGNDAEQELFIGSSILSDNYVDYDNQDISELEYSLSFDNEGQFAGIQFHREDNSQNYTGENLEMRNNEVNKCGTIDLTGFVDDTDPDTSELVLTETGNHLGQDIFNSFGSDVEGDGPGVHLYPTLTGDVNNDGRTDIVFVGQNWSGTGLNIRTKISNGDGTYTGYSDVEGDSPSVHNYPALTGDVNNDGRTDLVFVGQNWSGSGLNIKTKISNGNGTYTGYSDVEGDGLGVHVYPTLTGDVNNDGMTDLIFVGQNWSGSGLNIRTKISKGNGLYTGYSDIEGDSASIHNYPALTGDVNNDGRTDLIFVGQNWSGTGLNIKTKISNGNGTYTGYLDIEGDGPEIHDYPTLTGDVNDDDQTDLIFTYINNTGNLVICVKLSDGDGAYTGIENIQSDGAGILNFPVISGDFNGDNMDDLLFRIRGWCEPNALGIRLRLSNGDGSFTSKYQILSDGTGVDVYPALVGNFNDDSSSDLAFIGQDWGGNNNLNIRTKLARESSQWLSKAEESSETHEANPANLAKSLIVEPNYPNPFNPTTTIRYELLKGQNVTIKVYDLLGREVADLFTGWKAPGQHRVVFDARDLPSGTYFYRISTGNYSVTNRMLFIK